MRSYGKAVPTWRTSSWQTGSLLARSAASFFCVGVALVLPGALLPVLVIRLGLDFQEAGGLLAAQPLGHLVAVLSVPLVFQSFTPGRLVAVGFIPLTVSLGWLAVAASLPVALAAMFGSGLGIGLIEVGTNTELLRDPGRANRMMNLAHLFFGLACVLTPALATLFVDRGLSAGLPFLVASAASVASGLLWLMARPHQLPGPPRTSRSSHAPAQGMVFLGIAMALYVGAEIGLASWFTQYATQELGVSLGQAGWGLSLYWSGLTLGRLILGLSASAAPSARLVTGLALASTLSTTAMLLFSKATLYLLFAAITGVAFSGIFPGVMALAGRESNTDPRSATTLLLSAAAGGQMIFPVALGTFANRAGLSGAMWLYPALCVGLFGVLAVYSRAVSSP